MPSCCWWTHRREISNPRKNRHRDVGFNSSCFSAMTWALQEILVVNSAVLTLDLKTQSVRILWPPDGLMWWRLFNTCVDETITKTGTKINLASRWRRWRCSESLESLCFREPRCFSGQNTEDQIIHRFLELLGQNPILGLSGRNSLDDLIL